MGGVPQARDQRHDVLQVQAHFGGLEVSEAKRLKALEDEDAIVTAHTDIHALGAGGDATAGVLTAFSTRPDPV